MPSRQYLWQLKQQSQGNCIICGKPRTNYRYRCDACTAKQRIAARERSSSLARPKELTPTTLPPESQSQTAVAPAATRQSLL
jgi:predicted amidophosphoribosyltransferase